MADNMHVQVPGGSHKDDDQDEAAQQQIDNPGIDQLLDQIDSVLESDAQSFVEGFVQKGGQ